MLTTTSWFSSAARRISFRWPSCRAPIVGTRPTERWCAAMEARRGRTSRSLRRILILGSMFVLLRYVGLGAPDGKGGGLKAALLGPVFLRVGRLVEPPVAKACLLQATRGFRGANRVGHRGQKGLSIQWVVPAMTSSKLTGVVGLMSGWVLLSYATAQRSTLRCWPWWNRNEAC